MAQKVQVQLIDDLDGSEADGTVRFGLDGTEYEIDLSAEHAQELRGALARYVGAARRAGGGGQESVINRGAPEEYPCGPRPNSSVTSLTR